MLLAAALVALLIGGVAVVVRNTLSAPATITAHFVSATGSIIPATRSGWRASRSAPSAPSNLAADRSR